MAKAIVAALAALALLVPPAAEAAAKRTQLYAPRNDQFAEAFRLKSAPNLTLGFLGPASRELGEPKLTADSFGRTVWYRYTASTTGRAVVVLTTNRYASERHRLGVYKGSKLSSLTLIGKAAYDGNSTGAPTDTAVAVAFDTKAGQGYRIQVDRGELKGGPDAFFEIGVQQFGPEGGIALFHDRPILLSEGISSPGTDMGRTLVANAGPDTVKVKGRLGGLPSGTFKLSPTTEKTLGSGKTLWFDVTDNPAKALTRPGDFPGAVLFGAKLASTGATLPGAQRNLYAFRQDLGELGRPEILVRPKQTLTGVLDRQPVTTPVYIRNESLVKAVGCRFESFGQGAFGFVDVGPGTSGKRDAPFDIEPLQEKIYDVTVAGVAVALRCINLDTQFPGEHTQLNYGGQRGVVARILISTIGADTYKQIILKNKSRTVIVKLENTGEYSGDFLFDYTDTERSRLADVTSMCVSGPGGVCIGPSTQSTSTSINLAPGETGYVALKVARGTETEPGTVTLRASPEGRGTGYFAGIGSFELISK